MLVPLYILSPASRSGENNGLFIYDEAGFLMDTENEADDIGISFDRNSVCMPMSDLNGRLCPLIQGVDHASIPNDSQNPG